MYGWSCSCHAGTLLEEWGNPGAMRKLQILTLQTIYLVGLQYFKRFELYRRVATSHTPAGLYAKVYTCTL